MFHCELHRLDGNEKLLSDWRDLLTRVRPELRLFGPEWFAVWNRTIGAWGPWTGEMRVAAVYDDADGKLYGVLPVGHPKVGLVRVNAIGGYFQPWRLVLADSSKEYEVGRSFGWYLVELGWGVMQLGPWPMKHEAHLGLLSALNELEMPISRRHSDSLAIADVPPTWEQYQNEVIGSKMLKRIGNFSRKLELNHRVEVRHSRQPSDTDAAELLQALAQVEERSWLVNDPTGHPRFQNTQDQRFWAELIHDWLKPQGFLDAWVMSIDGQPASFVFAVTCGTTRYVIANQFDEAFTEYRTGSILYRQMFEEGYSRGVTRYDFGTNEIHYKSQWGATYQDRVDTFAVATNRLVGGLWKAGVKLKGLFNGTLWGTATEPVLPSGESLPSRSAEKILADVAAAWDDRPPTEAIKKSADQLDEVEV